MHTDKSFTMRLEMSKVNRANCHFMLTLIGEMCLYEQEGLTINRSSVCVWVCVSWGWNTHTEASACVTAFCHHQIYQLSLWATIPSKDPVSHDPTEGRPPVAFVWSVPRPRWCCCTVSLRWLCRRGRGKGFFNPIKPTASCLIHRFLND